MPDNVDITLGSGAKAAADEATYSGDTVKAQIVVLGVVTGAEGSRSLTKAIIDAVNGLAVDVTRIVPGTGATNLGKAEDAAHTSGDTGVMALAVRNDAGTALAGTTGKYIPLTTDATGALRTTGTGGGGAVTVADGANVAQGTTTDAESASGNGTLVAILKRLRTLLAGGLPAALGGAGGVKVEQVAALPVGNNNIGDVDIASLPVYTAPVHGELAGSITAVQLPSVPCKVVELKARSDNAGSVFIGNSSSVSLPNGTTDTTTGFELMPGDSKLYRIDNMNRLWRICENAGDDLTYAVEN